MPATWTRLFYDDEVVTRAQFTAQSIMVATAAATPQPLQIDENTIVGRLAGENISALTAAEVNLLLGVTFTSNFLINQVFS